MIAIKDFRFTKPTVYIGRNGMGTQIGIGMTADPYVLLLEPINSKNHLAHCQIRVPVEDIPTLIEKLTEIMEAE